MMIHYLNCICGAWIFLYACSRLSTKQRHLKSAELWIYALLVGTSIGVFYNGIYARAYWNQTIFNLAVALYFLVLALQRKREGRL